MARINPANERIKRDYFRLLKEGRGYDEATIDAVASSIARFESYTGHKAFSRFHIEQAIGFKGWLLTRRSERSGRPLAKSTLSSMFRSLREFFLWLSGQPGYRSRISFGDAGYFRLSEKGERAAQVSGELAIPSLEAIEKVLQIMPAGTELQRRDRAVIAFTILTGARDDAVASMRLCSVTLAEDLVIQDPRFVRTKAAKKIRTTFFPVGGSARQIVSDWISELRSLGWGDEDPLFPATSVGLDSEGQFASKGLRRSGWRNADPVRKIFRRAFEAAGMPYYKPHSFRKTIVQLGERICPSPEAFKAWSQNLGHEQVSTTLTSYGPVEPLRQSEIIRGLSAASGDGPQDDVAAALAKAGYCLKPLT